MDQSGYQIQPASEGSVKELKKEIFDLQKRLEYIESFLNVNCPLEAISKQKTEQDGKPITREDINKKVAEKRKYRTFRSIFKISQ